MNEESRAASAAAVRDLFTRSNDISAVMVAYRDGRSFVEQSDGRVEAGKFAAMSSSMVALGQSVLRELDAGVLDHVLIDGADGKLVVSVIPGSGGLLVISVLARRDARLGMVLGHAKTCALAVSSAIM